MTVKETNDFLKRIKTHYQEFIIDEFKVDEWYKELKNYDLEDVNRKFEEHLKSEAYGKDIPKLYFLTKYLTPTKDKGKTVRYKVICGKCGEAFYYDELEKHENRCYAASTVVRDMKTFFGRDLSKQKLMAISDEEFDNIYKSYLNKMVDADNVPPFRKMAILHLLYPELPPEGVDEIIRGFMKGSA